MQNDVRGKKYHKYVFHANRYISRISRCTSGMQLDARGGHRCDRDSSRNSLSDNCTCNASRRDVEQDSAKCIKFLIDNYNGTGYVSQLQTDMRLTKMGIEVPDFFIDHKDSFRCFVVDGMVEYVSAFKANAFICLDYNHLRNPGCSQKQCDHFHICKKFVSGFCSSEGCRCSHNFRMAHNLRLIQALSLDGYSDESLKLILRMSGPRVCLDYNENSCNKMYCSELHICSKYVRNEVHSKCELDHSFHSPNNSVILMFYDPSIVQLKVDMLKAFVFIPAKVASKCSGPSSSRVFYHLLIKHKGRARYTDEFHELFFEDVDVDAWFLRHKSQFNCLYKDGKLFWVSVRSNGAVICSNYNRVSKQRCPKDEGTCEYFHVCKNFVVGPCTRNCRFSHNFKTSVNQQLVEKYHFQTFNEHQLNLLFRNSQPQVCFQYNRKTCQTKVCPDLHLCAEMIRDNCSGKGCSLEHNLHSEHNNLILKVFSKTHWKDMILKDTILVNRNMFLDSSRPAKTNPASVNKMLAPPLKKPLPVQQDPLAKTNPASVNKMLVPPLKKPLLVQQDPFMYLSSLLPEVDPFSEPFSQPLSKNVDIDAAICERHQRQDPFMYSSSSLSPEADPFSEPFSQPLSKNAVDIDAAICEQHLRQQCRNLCCADNHCDLPYLWIIEVYGNWTTFTTLNEEIERVFGNPSHYAPYLAEVLIDGTMRINVELQFDTMTARSSNVSELPVRRLSTKSYCNSTSIDANNFLTVWVWYWMENANVWREYEPDALQVTIESKYLHGQEEYFFEKEHFQYKLDFKNLSQINLETCKVRKICRRTRFVSPYDVQQMRCPKFFKIPVMNMSSIPGSWKPVDVAHEFELYKLKEDSPDYKEVKLQFHLSCDSGRYAINSVYRVQNPRLWAAYCSMEAGMVITSQKDGRGSTVKKLKLFHGTDCMETARSICMHNFDWRLSGKNGSVYGVGCYFAKDAKYSSSYTKGLERIMFLADVLVGTHCKGEASYRLPPRRKGSLLYDSCVDNTETPSIYVVFERAQCYPTYLIHFSDVTNTLQQFNEQYRLPKPAATYPVSKNISCLIM